LHNEPPSLRANTLLSTIISTSTILRNRRSKTVARYGILNIHTKVEYVWQKNEIYISCLICFAKKPDIHSILICVAYKPDIY
jgi:hypothetical protein